MVPSPMLVDIEHESKLEVGLKESLTQDETLDDNMTCTNNCEDTAFDMEVMLDPQADAPEAIENDEVDVVEGAVSSEIMFVEGEDPDATEYSSSFGDSVSGNDDGSRLSDAEVDSGFCGDNGLGSNVFDGFNNLFHVRKKKSTTHWKKYTRSLMLQSRWVELRMKELRSQALRYERELASCSQRKQLELGQYASEGCARTLPFCHQIHRKKVMKRRKRKKIEDTVDIMSYMSSHRLFSYLEKKKSVQDADSSDEDASNQVNVADVNSNDELDFNYEWPPLEGRDSDNSIEQILWKIELAQSKVQKLKADIEKLPIDIVRFSSIEDLSSDLLTSSARSLSPGHGDEMPNGAHGSPQHMLEHDIGNLMPENTVSSYREEALLLDITESKVVPLSAETHQPQVQNVCKDLVDNVLINNGTAEKELQNSGKVSILSSKVKEEQVENKIVISPVMSLHPAPVSDMEPAPAPAPDPILDPESAPAPIQDPESTPAPIKDPESAPAPIQDPESAPAPIQESEAEKKPERPVQEASVIKKEIIQNISICSEFQGVPRKKRKITERKGSSSIGWNPEQISARRPSGVQDT